MAIPTGCTDDRKRLYDAICQRTKANFGQSVSPHLFRDGAATFFALNAPESIGSASALLGHADPKTLRHYNQAGSILAGRRLASVLQGRLARRGSHDCHPLLE
jgi:integrase